MYLLFHGRANIEHDLAAVLPALDRAWNIHTKYGINSRYFYQPMFFSQPLSLIWAENMTVPIDLNVVSCWDSDASPAARVCCEVGVL